MKQKQRSYTVNRIADDQLAALAKMTNRTKGGVIQELANKMAKEKGIRPNYAAMVDPEREYPVSYAYHQQRGRVQAPASGMMLGKDLTEPQIEQLYNDGLL